jgi:tripartite-type tricarboxylate transporter receptor subunit TctC
MEEVCMHASGNRRKKAAHGLLGLLFAALSAPALAQEFPSKPIRLIVPNAPGGGTDITGRALGAKLSQTWSQQIIVDNRAGGTGAIGMEMAARAAPDGYTIILVTGTQAARRATHRNLTYDLGRDYAPVTQITAQSYVLVINPSVPVKSIDELIALAKQKPDALTYGSSGQGSLQHLSGALLGTATKSKLLHVAYKGGGPALADVLAGQISMVFATPLESVPHIKTGRLRALAVTGAQRSRALPDLPTVAEFGVPGYDVTNWYGILAPLSTPKPVVDKLNTGFVETVKSPEMAERFLKDGVEPIGSTTEDFQRHIRVEIEKWQHVVDAAGIKVE